MQTKVQNGCMKALKADSFRSEWKQRVVFSNPFTMFNYIALSLLVCIAIASAQNCPPEGDSFLPHPDCTKYIVCDNGKEVLMDCPPDLFYNPPIEQCDFPENVVECVGETRPPVGGSTVIPTTTTAQPNTTTQAPPSSTESTAVPSEPTTTEAPPEPGVLTRCGDTITNNSGTIRYKLSQSYDTKELCSFVIRVPDHAGILFKLLSHGINASTDPNAINIFTFSEYGQIDAIHMGPPNPLPEVYVNGALAVVVFQTNGNRGRGFELSFEGVGRTAYSAGVELAFSNSSGGELVVPSWSNYLGTTSAVVLSIDHKPLEGFDYLKMVISEGKFYNCGSSVGCKCDSLRVFSFVSEHTVEEGLFCDQSNHRSVYQTKGILIVIFRKFLDGSAKARLTWNVSDL